MKEIGSRQLDVKEVVKMKKKKRKTNKIIKELQKNATGAFTFLDS